MTAETIARGIGGKRQGSCYMCKCPAHEDSNPSLAITEKDGKVLVKCHAGCSQRSVIDALKSLDLWESRNTRGPIVAEYVYTDERGKLLYQVVRFEPGSDGKPKDFSQRYPDGFGGWIWKKHPRQVLYRLPEVLEAPIVFLVEGERDVETLRNYGFVATTNAGGANAAWQPSFTGALRGREVILIPDNDDPGRLRVLTIARALYGHAAKIRILELKDGKDISEWFDRGHSEVELIALAEREDH